MAKLDLACHEKKLIRPIVVVGSTGIGLPVQKTNGPIIAVISTSIGLPVKNTIGSLMSVVGVNGFHGSHSHAYGYTFKKVQDWQNFISVSVLTSVVQ